MKFRTLLFLGVTVCMVSSCSSRKTMIDLKGVGEPREVLESYLEHKPETLAITGESPTRSADHIAESSSHKFMGLLGSRRTISNNYQLTGPKGTAWVAYDLEKRSRRPWKVVHAKVYNEKDGIQ